ncbi:MAG: oxaloacetate decarboxylase [Clostridiaceae bacterium]|jgi:Na+-transporting methylmalonyl-CoA/oxaloacetate decarboxylase gamma subunit|nr:oxaloacetate decarboxylase [Clostridiaceae bacterium]
MNTELIFQGLEVSALGLAGVFAALIAFYILIVFLGKIPEKTNKQ